VGHGARLRHPDALNKLEYGRAADDEYEEAEQPWADGRFALLLVVLGDISSLQDVLAVLVAGDFHSLCGRHCDCCRRWWW